MADRPDMNHPSTVTGSAPDKGRSEENRASARVPSTTERVLLHGSSSADGADGADAANSANAAARLSIADAETAVRDRIRNTLLRTDPILSDVMTHLTGVQGKNFRASLLLAAAADPDGFVSDDAVTAAAALEILHLATLVHDDVIDEANLRRGQPSVQSRFGKKTAVIGGDYLFTLCFSMIAGLSARFPNKFHEFSQAMSGICLGELRQLKHNGDTDLPVSGYLRIIAGKTAALFALAMYAGMILSGAEERESRTVARFGYFIGMLFQLADDCLDYASDTGTIKKASRHDLSEGVITLPLIYAFRKMPQLKALVRSRVLTPADIDLVVGQVIALGGVDETKALAERYAEKARRLLAKLPEPAKRERLDRILTQIEERRF